MNQINTFAIEGRLTADPEVRFTPNGKAVCNITIANSRGFGDNEKSNFFDAVIFGKSAENFGKYAEKGQVIHLSGEIEQQSWQTNDGQKRSKVVLKAWDWSLGKKSKAAKEDTPAEYAGTPREPEPKQANLDGSIDQDEDVPF
jgi:single-strand DNA-binding protein